MSNSYDRKVLEQMWESAENDTKRLNILFQVSLNTNERIGKLEKRKRFDTTISAGSGVVGGVVAMVSKWIFWK